jgi:hypothetical protein
MKAAAGMSTTNTKLNGKATPINMTKKQAVMAEKVVEAFAGCLIQ